MWEFDICFVSCLYTYTILSAMLSWCYDLSCLLIISFVAFWSARFVFEKLVVRFFVEMPWFMHCQQGWKFCTCVTFLDMSRAFSCISGQFLRNVHFWEVTGLTGIGHRSDRSGTICLQLRHQPDRYRALVWPIRDELLSRSASWWVLHAYFQGEFACVQGELACVQGELFFGLLFFYR